MTETSAGGPGLVERTGREARRSEWLRQAARFGLVAYGVVYLMIAWLAGQLAVGNHSGRPSPDGALAQVADRPLGDLLLWAIAVGLFVLVVWRVLEAIGGHPGADGADLARKRALSVGKAVLYGTLGVNAVRIALGGDQSSRAPKTMTAKVLDWPAGQWIVGLVALGIIVYGLATVWTGCTDRFLRHLDGEGQTGEAGRAYTWFGRAGHVAKGLAFGIVGGIIGYAAATHEPEKSGGLDQALKEVLDQPAGPALLMAIAAGIGCYGLFCFAWARHLAR